MMKRKRLIVATLGIILFLLLVIASVIIKVKFGEDILHTFDILSSVNVNESKLVS